MDDDRVPRARPKRPPTIYTVAESAGVSASTVSRALNKPGRINAKTERRIRDVADQLGYRLNPLARALPTGRTSTIALVFADITNPVYFDLIRSAERVAQAHEYTLVLTESQESADIELASVQRLQPAIDGVVLVSSRLDDDRIRALAAVRPVVVVNRLVEEVSSVVPEVQPGVVEVLDHLQSLGHHFVGYLSGPSASWMNRFRWETLLDQALERGMSIVELTSGVPTVDGGRRALRRTLASGVTAVVAYNDLMAMGLLSACRAEGVDVPGRLSVIGFDDIFGADLMTPALTTVRSPLADIGERAIRLLMSDGGGDPVERSPLPTRLIVRKSTGRRGPGA